MLSCVTSTSKNVFPRKLKISFLVRVKLEAQRTSLLKNKFLFHTP